MNEMKILFSDEYRLLTSIKGEVREALKDVNELLDCNYAEWDDLSMRVTAIASYAERIRHSRRLRWNQRPKSKADRSGGTP